MDRVRVEKATAALRQLRAAQRLQVALASGGCEELEQVLQQAKEAGVARQELAKAEA